MTWTLHSRSIAQLSFRKKKWKNDSRMLNATDIGFMCWARNENENPCELLLHHENFVGERKREREWFLHGIRFLVAERGSTNLCLKLVNAIASNWRECSRIKFNQRQLSECKCALSTADIKFAITCRRHRHSISWRTKIHLTLCLTKIRFSHCHLFARSLLLAASVMGYGSTHIVTRTTQVHDDFKLLYAFARTFEMANFTSLARRITHLSNHTTFDSTAE